MTMRQIAFSVAASGAVSPALPQYGGVKGEHNATILQFTLDSTFIGEGDVIRLRFTGGDGAVLSSDLIEETTTTDEGITFSYPLPRMLTIPAGQLCVRVAVTSLNENGDEVQGYCSNEAVVWFDEAEVENGTPFWTGVSEMLRRTVTAKDAAVQASNAANAAAAEAKGCFDEMRPEAIRVMNALSDAEKARSEAQTAAGKAVTSQQGASHFAAVAEECAAQAAAARDSVVSPHIGENGHWFIGETDTGVKAEGNSTVTDEQIAAAVEAYLEEHPVQGGAGLTAAQIAALDGMFKIAAYTADATAAYTAFKEAFGLNGSGGNEPDEPEKALTGITATYTGGNVAAGTAVTALTGVIVAATYSDGSTTTVTGYTLSGTIDERENIITVTYGGKTATFTVVGVAESGGETGGDDGVVNLFDKETMTIHGKFINGNGLVTPMDSDTYTANIPVEPNTTYAIQFGKFPVPFDALGCFGLFDSSDKLIGRVTSANAPLKDSSGNVVEENGMIPDSSGKGYIFTTTANTAFVKFTAKYTATGFDYRETVMLEVGNVCHDYVAYEGGAV